MAEQAIHARIVDILARAGYEAMVRQMGDDPAKDLHRWDLQPDALRRDWAVVARESAGALVGNQGSESGYGAYRGPAAHRVRSLMWLISFRSQSAYRTNVGIGLNAQADAIGVVKESPEEFLLHARKRYLDLQNSTYEPTTGVQRADNIICIYWAREIEGETAEHLAEVL